VDGDPVPRLALDYLGRRLPEPEADGASVASEQAPMLPLGLPPAGGGGGGGKRRLRIVK